MRKRVSAFLCAAVVGGILASAASCGGDDDDLVTRQVLGACPQELQVGPQPTEPCAGTTCGEICCACPGSDNGFAVSLCQDGVCVDACAQALDDDADLCP